VTKHGRIMLAVGAGVAAGLALGLPAPALAAPTPVHPLHLSGVPAVWLLRSGRVLVLRPHRLEVVLDGRLVRTVAVRQPVDLAQLPSLVADPGYARRLADGRSAGTGRGIRLAAVLAQRPGTAITATGLHLRLADTGGAGPARLTGTRARLTLRGARVDAGHAAPSGPVAAGFRYLHASNVSLDDVTLTGLGVPGAPGVPAVPALRADGGSALALRRLSLVGGGPGVDVSDATWLAVEGLEGGRVGGPLLTVSGGTGARIRDVSSNGSTGAAVMLRAAAGTAIDAVSSTRDGAALLAQDVDGLRAGRVRARGDGIVLGGRGIELTDVDVDAPVDGVRVTVGGAVVVRRGAVRGRTTAVSADPGARAVLDGVTTTGAVSGAVRVAAVPADAGSAGRAVTAWWDRPVRGTGTVAVVVLVAGVCLEVLHVRRRDGGNGPGEGQRGGNGDGGLGELPDGVEDGAPEGDLALDLGEQRVH
jgi:hypothetical protein